MHFTSCILSVLAKQIPKYLSVFNNNKYTESFQQSMQLTNKQTKQALDDHN